MWKRALRAIGIGGRTKKKVVDPIVVRRDCDMLRPGSVVIQDDRSYRVTKLLMVNRLGAFYEAKAE